jgi:hypothetical protein
MIVLIAVVILNLPINVALAVLALLVVKEKEVLSDHKDP